jgi:hypothetical protein
MSFPELFDNAAVLPTAAWNPLCLQITTSCLNHCCKFRVEVGCVADVSGEHCYSYCCEGVRLYGTEAAKGLIVEATDDTTEYVTAME